MMPGPVNKTKSYQDIAGETRRIKVIRTLSRKSWVHGVARLAIDYMKRRGGQPYQIDAIKCFAEDFRHSYLNTKPCIYTSAFVPNELIYGLGGVPFLPEAAAGFAASFGLANESLAACESLWYSLIFAVFIEPGLELQFWNSPQNLPL